MKRKSCILFATLPVALAASAKVRADTHLVVRSDSDCPSGQAVTEALRSIRPDEGSTPPATIHVKGDRVQVTLGENPANQREILVPADCVDRANRVAVVIAVWSRELPAQPIGSESLSVAMPAAAPVLAKPSAFITQLGLSGFYSTVGSRTPGARVELGRFRRDGWWGARAMAAFQSAKSHRVDIGLSQYNRTLLGASLSLEWNRLHTFLSGDLGLVGSYTQAHGTGYSQNQSAHGLNAGLIVDGRVGLRLGKVRIWSDLLLYRWANKETLRVDSLTTAPSSVSTLPAWDAHLGLGVGVVLD